MTPRGAFIALGVLVAFLAIFVPLARRINGGRDLAVDADRLRRTYAALALYETTHDGLPAPNLGLIRSDVEAVDLQSVGDSSIAGMDFPLDPARPDMPLRSSTRVSWSYRWHWPEAGDLRTGGEDPRRGFLASWWNGPVQRVTMDGSLVEKPHGALTFADLFGK